MTLNTTALNAVGEPMEQVAYLRHQNANNVSAV